MSFLSLEAALVDRLKAKLSSEVTVLTAADLSSVAEGSQPTPAVHVVVPGFRVLEVRPDGHAARVQVTALVVVAVRNVRGVRGGDGAKNAADPLIDGVQAALMGFKPEGFATPLALQTPPNSGFSAGFMYVPLAFNCEQALNPKAL